MFKSILGRLFWTYAIILMLVFTIFPFVTICTSSSGTVAELVVLSKTSPFELVTIISEFKKLPHDLKSCLYAALAR